MVSVLIRDAGQSKAVFFCVCVSFFEANLPYQNHIKMLGAGCRFETKNIDVGKNYRRKNIIIKTPLKTWSLAIVDHGSDEFHVG